MQTTNWPDIDHLDLLLADYTTYKLRHTNRFERYFPTSGKRRPKYYTPPRHG